MSKSYHEIMEKIEVTDDMRSRILNNVSRQAINTPHKLVTFPHLRKMASIAACLVLLLIGGTLMKNEFHPADSNPGQEMVGGAYGIEECTSIAELSQKAGFKVKEIPETDIPFKVNTVSYQWCWDEFAQVVYEGNNNSLTYRKAKGTEDISGDYTQYEQVLDQEINGVSITFKGTKDKYELATWVTQGYSYSINITESTTIDILSKLIQDCMD